MYPSGAALATRAAPSEPLAPTWFSMMTGICQASPSFCPIARARISFEPPAENGTTSVMRLAAVGIFGVRTAGSSHGG